MAEMSFPAYACLVLAVVDEKTQIRYRGFTDLLPALIGKYKKR